MIRHTLFIRFRAETAPSDRDLALKALIALCDLVGQVTSFACGPEVDPRSQEEGFTHGFVVVFGTIEARDEFRALPEYALVFEMLSKATDIMRLKD